VGRRKDTFVLGELHHEVGITGDKIVGSRRLLIDDSVAIYIDELKSFYYH